MRGDRKARRAWSRNIRHLSKVAKQEFEKAQVHIAAVNKGTDWSDPDVRWVFVKMATRSWANTFGIHISTVQSLPPRVPLQMAAHLFLVLTAAGVFWPRDYELIRAQMPWLDEALITPELMRRVSENPKVIDSNPESLNGLMTGDSTRRSSRLNSRSSRLNS